MLRFFLVAYTFPRLITSVLLCKQVLLLCCSEPADARHHCLCYYTWGGYPAGSCSQDLELKTYVVPSLLKHLFPDLLSLRLFVWNIHQHIYMTENVFCFCTKKMTFWVMMGKVRLQDDSWASCLQRILDGTLCSTWSWKYTDLPFLNNLACKGILTAFVSLQNPENPSCSQPTDLFEYAPLMWAMGMNMRLWWILFDNRLDTKTLCDFRCPFICIFTKMTTVTQSPYHLYKPLRSRDSVDQISPC